MPGLAGIMGKQSDKGKGLVGDLIRPLVKYDWYKTEHFQEGNLSLAHVHTNILSDQDFVVQGDVCACMHGEIYNEDLNGQHQAEYVIDLYKAHGEDFPLRLNGSFAISLFDAENDSLYLVTDRVASKPVIYYLDTDNDRFFFAPELKCIQRIPDSRFRANKHAVSYALSTHYIPSNETFLEGVLCLEPGSILRIHKGQLAVKRYWEYLIDENAEDLGFDYYREKLSELLHKAVDIRLRSNHRYGLSLSGGNDSKIILGCCRPYADRVKAFSYGSYKRSYTDGGTAKRLAETANMEHYLYIFKLKDHFENQLAFIRALDGMGCCQNMADAVSIWKKVREDHGIQILLVGDNLFGDLYGHKDSQIDEEYMFKSLSIHFLRRTRQFKPLLKDGMFELLEDLSNQNMKRLSGKCPLNDIRARREYFHLESSTFRYYSCWRYVISSEIEVRTPWYDSAVLEFVRTIPFEYRHNKNLSKKVGALMFPELFQEGLIAKKHGHIKDTRKLCSIKVRKRDILKLLVEEEYPIDKIFNKEKIRELLDDGKLNILIAEGFIAYLISKLKLPQKIIEQLQKFKKGLHHPDSAISGTPLDRPLHLEFIILRLIKVRQTLKGVEKI